MEKKATAIDALWSDLGSADATRAYRSIWALTAAPREAVAWMKAHLHATSHEDAALAERLVRDLDDKAFKVREKADQGLRELADIAVPALERSLADSPSLETRRRVEKLLNEIERPDFSRVRQKLRAVEALERIGTAEARELLATLARGAPEARLTREAAGALRRLSSNVLFRT
jgi:hypothetical protein